MEEVINKNYTEEMQQSFYDYAMTTITNRALPDVRDGLKPVHRRILYGMNQMKMFHNKPYKKSARIVGDILGKYHPHGDSSVYEAMVRLSQDFSLMIPVVDGHGNFGSIDGDGAAAMRYTEARLSLAGESMSLDLDKELVEFQDNYDDSEIEPTVLPARFPNLIVNGSEGIATGMATNIPTHNPIEVANAWEYMIKSEGKIKEKKLLSYLSAPDYPYGGMIINKEEVREFYTTGYSRVVMRGQYHIEKGRAGSKRVVFTELPRSAIGSKNRLINQLIESVNDKTLVEITDIVDESSREGIRLVLDVRKGTNMDLFMNKLWLNTNLQSSDRMQFLVLIDGKPETINLERYFEEYIKFQKELHIRRNTYLLKEVENRLEIVDGLLEAHSVMDVLIDAIRNAKTSKSLLNCLTKGKTKGIDWRLKKHRDIAEKFSFTERQANAILNRRLRTLTGLDIKQLTKEQKELYKQKEFHQSVINDKKALRKELLKDVDSFKTAYPIERKAEVTTKTADATILEELTAEKIGITVDENGFAQARESVSGTSLNLPLRVDTDTNSVIAVFTSKGNMYQVRTTDIPSDRKMPLQVLTKMKPGEKIIKLMMESEVADKEFFMLTKYGRSKMIDGKDIVTQGYRARTHFAKVDNKSNDDVLILTEDTIDKWLLIKTNKKRGGRIDLKSDNVPLRKMGKGAMGSRIVTMKKDEYIKKFDMGANLNSNIGKTKGKVKDFEDITGRTVRKL